MTSSEASQRCHRGRIPLFTCDGQAIPSTHASSVQNCIALKPKTTTARRLRRCGKIYRITEEEHFEEEGRRCPGPIRIGVLRAVSHRALPKIWGEVRQDEISRINLLNQLTVGFGLIANTLPFGIVTEGLPVGGCGLSARMREDVDESFAFQRFVGGRPVRHVFYSMLLE